MEDLEKRAIEDLLVVSSERHRLHTGDKTHKAGVYVNLRCCASSSYGDCGAKLVGSIRKSSERPTNIDCFRELGRVIWIYKLGTVPGSMSCVEKKFELQVRKWEEYKGTRYSDGDSALVVDLWLYWVADDLSGLTFQEWDPSAGSDDTSAPVAMLVNSSELRAADFHLAEVRPLQLDVVTLGGRRTRGAAVRKLQGVGKSTFVLSVENDNDFRSRCE
jgi:hypothetical protein